MDAGGQADVSSIDFRNALAQWATGVAVVSVRDQDGLSATTVSSFNSLTLEPPLVLVALADKGKSLPRVLAAGAYTISVLTSEQREISERCAQTQAREEDFDAEGRVQGALVSLRCAVHDTHRHGGHLLLVGRVLEVRHNPRSAEPLLYWNRDYRSLSLKP